MKKKKQEFFGDDDVLLSAQQVVEYLNRGQEKQDWKITIQTLAQWRHAQNGPVFTKMGRWVRYSKLGLQQWLSDRIGSLLEYRKHA